jgi:DNA-binding MarR family transcriptional regulator
MITPDNAAADPATPEGISTADVRELTEVLGRLMRGIRHRSEYEKKSVEHGTLVVLSVLHREGPMRVSELARSIGLDLSTVSRHVRTLELSGEVARTGDPEDRRAYRIAITDRGRPHIERVWAERIEWIKGLIGHWSHEDITTLTRLLSRLFDDFVAGTNESCEETR